MDRIPSEDETFEKLGALKGLWYESLYSATLDTTEHFKANSDHRLEQSQLFSWHVRSKLQILLEPQAEAYNFSIVNVPGGSFNVAYGFYVCKFRKAYNGNIPLPTSKTQLQFYNSNSGLSIWPTLPGWEPMRTIPAGSTVSLIIYYDLNTKHELEWVKIACPRFATLTEVQCFWDKPIENPLFSGSAGFQVKHSTKERKDLSFTFREDDDTSTELAE